MCEDAPWSNSDKFTGEVAVTDLQESSGEEEGWPEELRASDRLLDHSLKARVLPESLQPLAPFQDQLTILQGLSGKMCRGGHSAWYGALGCYHTGDEDCFPDFKFKKKKKIAPTIHSLYLNLSM